MIANEAQCYFCPSGYCQNPIAYQHTDGKVYCKEHQHCAQEIDLSLAKTVYRDANLRREMEALVQDWQERDILPRLEDGSRHPMDHSRWACGEILKKRLTAE